MAHRSVLLQSLIEKLDIKKGDIVFDGTVGDGGHSEAVCNSSADILIIGLDLDSDSLIKAEKKLQNTNCKFFLRKSDFRHIDSVLDDIGIQKVDKIIIDMGLNSDQLDVSGRGFSFQKNEPLIMTYSKKVGKEKITAKDLVNDWSEDSLAEVFDVYGDERFSKKIAKKIVERREIKKIEKTFDLVEIIKEATPKFYHFKKIHPATKVFQALRMVVNSDLESLNQILHKGFERLNSGGRIAVISFNSLEDRIVKNFFKNKVKEKEALFINKKPIIPSINEIKDNPRSRSAKLRVISKI